MYRFKDRLILISLLEFYLVKSVSFGIRLGKNFGLLLLVMGYWVI